MIADVCGSEHLPSAVVIAIQFVTIFLVVGSAIILYAGWDVSTNVDACLASPIICLFGYAINKVSFTIHLM
jgi:hypothetical protein